jgi:hypothetical protein
MKTFVYFKSDSFPSYKDEEEQINEGIWGKRLAEYLMNRLLQHHIAVEPFIIEDWGYYIPLSIDNVKLAVCCANQDGTANQFVCFTDPKGPIKRQWFRKIDISSQLDKLINVLNQILQSDESIYDIDWSDY